MGDSIGEYGSCDLALLGPGLPHTWAVETASEATEPGDNYVVHFTRESIGLDFLQPDGNGRR